jgi:hypothetical protein
LINIDTVTEGQTDTTKQAARVRVVFNTLETEAIGLYDLFQRESYDDYELSTNWNFGSKTFLRVFNARLKKSPQRDKKTAF